MADKDVEKDIDKLQAKVSDVTQKLDLITQNMAEYLTNSVNMTSKFYDIFFNPVAQDVTITLYNEDNEPQDFVVPNRAKDKVEAGSSLVLSVNDKTGVVTLTSADVGAQELLESGENIVGVNLRDYAGQTVVTESLLHSGSLDFQKPLKSGGDNEDGSSEIDGANIRQLRIKNNKTDAGTPVDLIKAADIDKSIGVQAPLETDVNIKKLRLQNNAGDTSSTSYIDLISSTSTPGGVQAPLSSGINIKQIQLQDKDGSNKSGGLIDLLSTPGAPVNVQAPLKSEVNIRPLQIKDNAGQAGVTPTTLLGSTGIGVQAPLKSGSGNEDGSDPITGANIRKLRVKDNKDASGTEADLIDTANIDYAIPVQAPLKSGTNVKKIQLQDKNGTNKSGGLIDLLDTAGTPANVQAPLKSGSGNEDGSDPETGANIRKLRVKDNKDADGAAVDLIDTANINKSIPVQAPLESGTNIKKINLVNINVGYNYTGLTWNATSQGDYSNITLPVNQGDVYEVTGGPTIIGTGSAAITWNDGDYLVINKDIASGGNVTPDDVEKVKTVSLLDSPSIPASVTDPDQVAFYVDTQINSKTGYPLMGGYTVKGYVDTQIATNSANFKGSYETWAKVPDQGSDFDGGAPANNDYIMVLDYPTINKGTWNVTGKTDYTGISIPAHKGDVYEVTGGPTTIGTGSTAITWKNGDCLVINKEIASGGTITNSDVSNMTKGTWRFKYTDPISSPTYGIYNKNKWVAEYNVNSSAFTPNQLAAIDSGVTSESYPGNAATATKATQDGSGNVITSTYKNVTKYGLSTSQNIANCSGYQKLCSITYSSTGNRNIAATFNVYIAHAQGYTSPTGKVRLSMRWTSSSASTPKFTLVQHNTDSTVTSTVTEILKSLVFVYSYTANTADGLKAEIWVKNNLQSFIRVYLVPEMILLSDYGAVYDVTNTDSNGFTYYKTTDGGSTAPTSGYTQVTLEDNSQVTLTNAQEVTGLKTFKVNGNDTLILNNSNGGAGRIAYQTNGTTKGYVGVSSTGIPVFWSSAGTATNILRNSTFGTAVGSGTKPCYIDTDGVAKVITSYEGNAATATKATGDKNGNDITTTYVNLTGAQTITGAKTFQNTSSYTCLTLNNSGSGSAGITFAKNGNVTGSLGLNGNGRPTYWNTEGAGQSLVRNSAEGSTTGSATQPVYINQNGVAYPITSYEGTSAVANSIKVQDSTANATYYPLWTTSTGNSLNAYVTTSKLKFNPSSGVFEAPSLLGTSSSFGGALTCYRDATTSDTAIKFSNKSTTTGYIGMSSGGEPRQWLGSDPSKWYKLARVPQNQASVGSATLPVYINSSGIAQTITSYEGNAATATKATQDGSGNVITSTYVNLTGAQTITGTKIVSNESFGAGLIVSRTNNATGAAAIQFRNGSTVKGYIGVDATTATPRFWESTTSNVHNLVMNSTAGSATGSATKPVYIDTDGVAKVITSYEGKANTAGTADVANKLGTATLGNVYTPIYLNGGTATKCSVLNMTSPSNLGYTATVGATLPTTNTLASWNGRYNATNSNLMYCTNGEIVGTAGAQTITGAKAFNGNVSLGSNATATTPAAGDNSTKVATTAWVNTAVSQGANIIGQIITSPIPLNDSRVHPLDGSVLYKSGAYADFVDYIAEIYNKTTSDFVQTLTFPNFPRLTANGSLGGASFAVSASENNGKAWYAFSSDPDGWTMEVRSGGTGNYTVDVDYIMYNPYPFKITSLTLRNPWDNGGSHIRSGKIYGSNDGTNYTELAPFSNSNGNDSQAWGISIPANVQGFYRYYKIKITSIYQGTSAVGFWSPTITAYYKVHAGFTELPLWNAINSEYGVCGKFVYDSTNNSVKLPNLTGFIEGTGYTDITGLGSIIDAGLPNITGTAGFRGNSLLGSSYASKAFGYETITDTVTYPTNGSNTASIRNLTFSANASNEIYGNSSTVQPQAVKVYYYIVVAAQAKSTQVINIDNITTDLNNKADKSAVDGQWVYSRVLLNSSTAINSYNIDLSELLPDDGYSYQCVFANNISRSDTSVTNSYINFYVNNVNVFYNIQDGGSRSTESKASGTQFEAIIGPDRLIKMDISNYALHNQNTYLVMYRRVGTNT